MWEFALYLLVLCVGVHSSSIISRDATFPAPELRRIPPADGRFHLYVLPVGQGDSNVLQCPDGDLSLFDFGSSNGASAGFWHINRITEWLGDQMDNIRNIIITHNHYDHYRFLPEVFTDRNMLPGLYGIYISCTSNDVAWRIEEWLEDLQFWDKIFTFNDGGSCGPNGVDCGYLPLCPNSQVQARVMAANLGQNCVSGNTNVDSIVLKVTYGDVSVLLNGDFEDETTDWGEDGPQKWMVDYYGSELISTVYQLAHHGADRLANKPVMRDSVMPKALFASNNPWYSNYQHPRCSVIDAFINFVGSLCKPEETDTSSEYYCGPQLDQGNPASVQDIYTCGDSSDVYRRTGNDYAIYTTTPDEDTLNLITFSTDGEAWGVYTSIEPRVK